MTLANKVAGDLHFHQHNVLCVAAWSAFEGFMQAALAEEFTANPRLLSSDKKLSVSEVIAAGDGLIEYLVAKEIDDIGRLSFDGLQNYVRSRFKVQFSKRHAGQLRDAYFLRNVIAHGAGMLRPNQLHLVPPGVDVKDRELRISKEYLEGIVDCITSAVREFDQQIRRKVKSGPLKSDLNRT